MPDPEMIKKEDVVKPPELPHKPTSLEIDGMYVTAGNG